MLERSVSATAGWPSWATRLIRSGMRTMPSTTENSEWTRKWTKAGVGLTASDMARIVPSRPGRRRLFTRVAARGAQLCNNNDLHRTRPRGPVSTMKWLIPGIWLASILFAHFRGRVRLRLSRQLLDQSVLLAPVNALMVLCSRVPTTPYLPAREIPELQVLDDHWETIRDEALKMAELRRIKAAERHDDIGFNSFFKYGWKRFYLKWYDARHPSAEELCPRTVEILKRLPKVKAAMF